MKIALIGYGKMGRAIEEVALKRGHEISLKATASEADFSTTDLQKADIAIEFSEPASAANNILKCFNVRLPVVVGTTGWYDRFEEIRQNCAENDQSLFYATNFSIGVNVFFEINKRLAALMNDFPDYDVSIEEQHHSGKLDSPSGTAITIAEDIIGMIKRKERWVNQVTTDHREVGIASVRQGDIPGTHAVKYVSDIDSIEIMHSARNRTGFAAGAVTAAEWLLGKKGIYTMKDMLDL